MKKIFALVLVTLFTACSLAPDYNRPEMPLPEGYSENHLDGESVANLPWWEFFKNTQLQELIRIALENNRDLQISAKRIEEARALVTFTHANQFPFVDLSASAQRFDNGAALGIPSSGPVNDFSIAGNLTFEVDVFSKLKNATDAQREQLVATEYAHNALTLSLVSQVADFYFQLLDLEARMQITERTIKSRSEATDIIRKRLEKGIVPELDVNQAEIEEYESEIVRYILQRQRAQVENALKVLLGDNNIVIVLAKSVGNPMPQDVPTGLPAGLLERRPDILQAESLIRAQYENIGVAKALQYPSFSLLGTLGLRSSESSDLFSSDSKTWSAGGGILSPFINWHQNQARVEAEIARGDQAVKQYEQSILVAVQEVENALSSIRTFKAENDSRTRQVKAAQNASKLSRARYDDGVTSYLEVLDSDRSLFSAELAQSLTHQRYLTSIIQLYKALGGGWELQKRS